MLVFQSQELLFKAAVSPAQAVLLLASGVLTPQQRALSSRGPAANGDAACYMVVHGPRLCCGIFELRKGSFL